MVVYEACWTVIPRSSDIGTKAGLARDPLTVFFQTSRCNRQSSIRTFARDTKRREQQNDIHSHPYWPVLEGRVKTIASTISEILPKDHQDGRWAVERVAGRVCQLSTV